MKKGKYQISVSGKLVEVDALEFAVFGYGTLIVHRDALYPNLWTVSEPRTGYSWLAKQKTRKAAMEESVARLLRSSPEWFHNLIVSQLQYQKTPRTRFQQENFQEVESV